MRTHFWKKNREIGEFDPFGVEESISGEVWSAQKPIAISDLDREQQARPCIPVLKRHGIRSYTMLPVSTESMRYGALGLGQSAAYKPAPNEIELLSQIAKVVAFALENQAMHNAVLEREERLQSLITICNELRPHMEFDRLIPAVLETLRRIVHYDHAVLAVLEDDGAVLRMYGIDIQAWEKLLVGGLRVPLSKALSSRAIESRSTAFFDIADLEAAGTPMARAILEGGIQSLCVVPLVSASRTWGSLNVGSIRNNAFPPDETEYLQQVANQIAGIFENAHAHKEIAELKEASRRRKKISGRRRVW